MHNYMTSLRKNPLVLLAWTIMLIGSYLPDILIFELTGSVPDWLLWVKLILFTLFIVLSLVNKPVSPLRPFTIVLFVYLAGTELVSRVSFDFPWLQSLLGNSTFIQRLQPEQFAKLAVVLLVMLVLLLLGYRRAQMFLVLGNLKAPIKPVKWLGFPKPDSWVSFGGQLSVYFALGTGFALWLISGTPLNQLGSVIPVLPAILLMATFNAFNEEFIYRSSVLGTLEDQIGRNQVWWLSAVFFGIAHYWGVPYGIFGIALATFMGWILAKAMLETHGFFWSWWIHFLQDIAIFIFIAAGTVTPGG